MFTLVAQQGAFDISPIWISLKVVVVATLVTALAGIMLARWRMTYQGKLASVLDIIFILPLALPPTVIGLVLLLAFGNSSPVSAVINIIFTWHAAVVASIIVSFPLMYQTALASFKQIDATLIDLARIDGFSEWKILWRVMVPLAWHGLAAGATLSFVRALGEFGATLMIAGNIPGKTQTMPLAIFFSVEAGEIGYAVFLSCMNIAISITAIALINYFERRR
ncbi:MAG: molybdate ABC transporter permease subunit [Bacteroidetes bacterium]|nr:MAG: molybdate ABC transporter permease subunit [Bacteroidota bacterium]